MPKTKISEYSATAGDNTDIQSINIAEGCAPSGINDAIRTLMSHLKNFQSGTSSDTYNANVAAITTANIVTLNVTGTTTFNSPVVMASTFSLTNPLPISSGGTGSTSTTFVNLATNVTGTLPVANGGTGITSLGSGVATWLGTPSSANLAAAVTDETGSGALVFANSPTLTGTATVAVVQMADNDLIRPKLMDYAIKGSALGNTGTAATINSESANFFSATSTAATTWSFTNPVASGDFGTFVLELTNGGAYTNAWPAAVDWPGGIAPTLTSSGKDQLVFTTRDGGTTWLGFVAGLDIK